ncbi:MAG: molecular chaperone DnaJ [Candidatus Paceibacterota bacterium]|jgi:molecular chaperone DnaJ
MSKDYYKILGVEKNASQDEIKKAFRKLAHEHHPDKKTGNAEKFKEANEAYGVLSDEKKRQQYDTFGSAGPGFGGQGGFNAQDFGGFDFSQFGGFQGGNVEFDIGDMFGDIFGGGRQARTKRGADISIDLEIPFADAIFGTERTVLLAKTSACSDCAGSGAKPGSKMDTCSVCDGKGRVNETRRSILGTFSTARTCDTCHGSGKVPHDKCATCHGKGIYRRESELSIRIPSGLEDGEMIRLTGAGEAVAGGAPGDLYVKVHVKKHPTWRKEGHNLVTDLNVRLSDALLGSEYPLATLDGDINLKIPEGVSHGEVLRIRGKGVPADKHHRGDALVVIHIAMPRKLSKDAKKRIEELKKEGL